MAQKHSLKVEYMNGQIKKAIYERRGILEAYLVNVDLIAKEMQVGRKYHV
jgi:hypothetical protein